AGGANPDPGGPWGGGAGEPPAVTEEPIDQQLTSTARRDDRDREAGVADAPPRQCDPRHNDCQQHEGEWACCQRENRADSESPATPLLQRPDRKERERHRERERKCGCAD